MNYPQLKKDGQGSIEIIQLLDMKDIMNFKEYALDHLEAYGAVPCEYETGPDCEEGIVWDVNLCWDVSVFLGLTEKIT